MDITPEYIESDQYHQDNPEYDNYWNAVDQGYHDEVDFYPY